MGNKKDYGPEPLNLTPNALTTRTLHNDRSPRSSTSDNLLQLELEDHYDIIKDLGKGTYGKVILARCKETDTKVALKILPKLTTKQREFKREFNYSYYLSPHYNIVDTYNVVFETNNSFIFAQEYTPLGDLFDAIPPQIGMAEKDAKTVIQQVASALDFMHSKNLVHRDIKPENVLIFEPDFSRVKLMDFGMTKKDGVLVRKINGSIPYTPPEICEAVKNEGIVVRVENDIWALGVLLFCMLTGNFPWENADIGDMYFKEFVVWQRRKSTKIPSQWRKFTPRLMRFFRKCLDIKIDKRCPVREVFKYVNDPWLVNQRRSTTPVSDEERQLGDSDSDNPMGELTSILQNHGIDTHVDKHYRDRRISEWLLSL